MHYPSLRLSKFGQIEWETVRDPLLSKAMDCLFEYIGNNTYVACAISNWGHLVTARFGACA